MSGDVQRLLLITAIRFAMLPQRSLPGEHACVRIIRPMQSREEQVGRVLQAAAHEPSPVQAARGLVPALPWARGPRSVHAGLPEGHQVRGGRVGVGEIALKMSLMRRLERIACGHYGPLSSTLMRQTTE